MHYANIQMPASFRQRLLIVYFAGMLVSALLVGIGVVLLAGPFNQHTLRSGVVDYTDSISRRVVFSATGEPIGLDESKIERWLFTSLAEEVVLRILDSQGNVVYSPAGGTTALAPAGEVFRGAKHSFMIVHNGVPMHAATTPLKHNGTLWYVQLAVSDRFVLQLRETLVTPALSQGILIMCLTFLLVFLVATHVTLQHMFKPLRRLSIAAQGITPTTLEARLDVKGVPSELSPLVQAFNSALDRLQDGFRTQQEFLANAAHELKTPLALIRAQLEVSGLHATQPYLVRDVDHMARQVQQLLLLAEASELRNYRVELRDPLPILREACDYLERSAKSARVTILLGMTVEPLAWHVDRGGLFTLLKNLLENAIQHSPPGGQVKVEAHRTGFEVVDEGPGVAPEKLSLLFVRFWRGESRRDDGAGLGLSICQEIASAHRWTIAAENRSKGLAIKVSFAPTEHQGAEKIA